METNKEHKSNLYATLFTQKIENGIIKRKRPPNHGEKFSTDRDVLSLHRYKRYIGSLRCVLDAENMRDYRACEYL